MTEYAEIEERKQDVAAQSVPEKKEVDKVDDKKDVKGYVDSLLTKLYTTFDNNIDGVNYVLKNIAKTYNPTDKEFVGFVEYILRKVDEKGNAGWLLKQDAFKKLFVQWRWDKEFQKIIYRNDKDDGVSTKKQYYKYLEEHNNWYLSILNS